MFKILDIIRKIAYNIFVIRNRGNEMLKVYFDNCCYNRPYDDQTQAKIQMETNAIMDIIKYSEQNKCTIYSSVAVEFEMNSNKDLDKKNNVIIFYNSIKNKKIKLQQSINARAKELLSKYNIKYKDGLHIAFCELEEIDYLISTDKLFINASNRADLKVKVINPRDFIEEVS